MRELSVQSASDTNEGIDRNALDAEFQQLIKEIDDIANKADFNGRKLLDGSLATAKFTGTAVDEALALKNGMTLTGAEKFDAGTYGFAYTAAEDDAPATLVISDSDTSKEYTISSSGDDTPFAAGTVYDIMDGTTKVGTITLDQTAIDALSAAGSDISSLEIEVDPDVALIIQTGANNGDTLSLSIGDMGSEALGVSAASIAARDGASSAITTVGKAINSVSTQRAALGAMQNRLEHKINNLDTSAENLQSAESRIRDIDMAKEMTKYTQTSIMVQAATSMLAQANNAPQNVLSLLR